ncbi:hypothetical protein CCICO_10200 [Corynebacterium ciconiae DSM 44920]|uniref:hypothetical protein n=1 Tax=Corynebacterium ciconiae TaxID=227319 RepID=UPI00036E6AA3|nr:hypothetical protein [Corynebacterium ciconiae]WKD62039.1 hypothetical protein CCICO_10200 [Corynebacterium ciconiae DSM 44920]
MTPNEPQWEISSKQTPPATPQSASSYTTGVVHDRTEKYSPSFSATSVLSAPWTVWGAAALYAALVGWLLYSLVEELMRSNARDLLVIAQVVSIVVIVTGVVGVLKAQVWGRWLLTAVSVVTIFLIVVGSLWIATLLAVAAAVILWLPFNQAWFGYRRRG